MDIREHAHTSADGRSIVRQHDLMGGHPSTGLSLTELNDRIYYLMA